MLNKVTLLGRIGKINTSIATATKYSLATTKSTKNAQTGNWDEKTEWHQLVSFGKCSEHIRNKLQPGDLVYIEGELQTTKWQDQQGNDKYTTEVVVFDFPKKLPKYYNQNGSRAAPQQAAPQQPQAAVANGQPMAMPADDWAGDINF
jgi:single-strand DNA-binding protein